LEGDLLHVAKRDVLQVLHVGKLDRKLVNRDGVHFGEAFPDEVNERARRVEWRVTDLVAKQVVAIARLEVNGVPCLDLVGGAKSRLRSRHWHLLALLLDLLLRDG